MTNQSSALSTSSLSCQNVIGLLETFVDGELPPEQTLHVEAHLNVCETCQTHAEFQQVVANSVQRVVHDDIPVSPAFLARIDNAVAIEAAREVAKAHTQTFSWQSKASALALAASIAAWFTFRPTASNDNQHDNQSMLTANRTHSTVSPAAPHVTPTTAHTAIAVQPVALALPQATAVVPHLAVPHAVVPPAAGSPDEDNEEVTIEGALDRLIDVHSSPQKPQITTAELLPAMEPEIGVRIELPKLNGARWEGASVVPVRKNQRAASLRYRTPTHRMTLYVFDASKLHVRPPEQPQRALNAPLYVGQWRGYTVAAKENRGVGYALAADMDDVAVTRLISEIH